ncbi:MAG: type II secretion system protein [Chthoniobacteraceae bacterium]
MKAAAPFRGFSLIEIVLVIGVISFSLVAILGLLSAGLNSSKNALDESLIAAMSRQVISSLRQQYFTNNTLFTSLETSGSTNLKTVYFNTSGVLVDGTASGFDRPIYECVVTAVSRTDLLGPAPKVSISIPCLLDLTLTFNWPMADGKVVEGKASTYNLHTSIARYY